jgi:hypothetical protein
MEKQTLQKHPRIPVKVIMTPDDPHRHHSGYEYQSLPYLSKNKKPILFEEYIMTMIPNGTLVEYQQFLGPEPNFRQSHRTFPRESTRHLYYVFDKKR